ncbi:hypothetical protein GA845_13085 [Burkholderia pseudomallei]|nr:hypothetical protein [Burkholderia pseudomallei]
MGAQAGESVGDAAGESAQESTCEAADESKAESAHESARESVHESARESPCRAPESTRRGARDPTCGPVRRWGRESAGESTDESTGESTGQSARRSAAVDEEVMRLPRVGKLSVNVNEMYYQFARVSISTQLLLISRQFHSTGCTVRPQPAVWPDARARPAAVRPATARATCARCQPTDLR